MVIGLIVGAGVFTVLIMALAFIAVPKRTDQEFILYRVPHKEDKDV